MSTPNSRAELIEYCLKRLGKPVIQINVDYEQLEDRVDDALQMYREFHTDGTQEVPVPYQITDTDISNEYITISDIDPLIDRIDDILPLNVGQTSSNFFSFEYQFRLNDMHSLINMPVQDFFLVKQHLKLFEIMFSGKIPFRYNRNERKLYLDTKWGTRIQAGNWIVVNTNTAIDPEAYSNIFNDIWIKNYTTALFKRQWGYHLSKYQGLQMLGGITYNGQDLISQANEEVQSLETQLREMYETPAIFLVG